jgi:hypothetical protein
VRVQWQSWLLSLIFAWLIELAAFANAISSCVENILFVVRFCRDCAVDTPSAPALHDRRVCLTSVAAPIDKASTVTDSNPYPNPNPNPNPNPYSALFFFPPALSSSSEE